MHRKLLIDPKKVNIPEVRDGMSLDTAVLEEEMKLYNGGIDLSTLDPEHSQGDERLFKQYVPVFGIKDVYSTKNILKTANKYPDIDGPCAMSLKDTSELEEHMIIGYQTAHFHYILGRKHNLRGSFPRLCCGVSSLSIMMSLMTVGYPNAAYAYSKTCDHGYVILPFIIRNENILGSILIDPTSNQLWKAENIRNAVMIKIGTEWEYRADWQNGGNMFPDRICSIDIMRKAPEDISETAYYHKDARVYLTEAFNNPVMIEPLASGCPDTSDISQTVGVHNG
jgi:hypothetical protein